MRARSLRVAPCASTWRGAPCFSAPVFLAIILFFPLLAHGRVQEGQDRAPPAAALAEEMPEVAEVIARLRQREERLRGLVFEVDERIWVIREDSDAKAAWEEPLMNASRHVLSFDGERFQRVYAPDLENLGWSQQNVLLGEVSSIWDGTHYWVLSRLDGRRPTVGIHARPEGPQVHVEYLTVLGLHELGWKMTLDLLELPRTEYPLLPLSAVIELSIRERGDPELEIVTVQEAVLPVPLPSGSERLLKLRFRNPIVRDAFHIVWLDMDGDMSPVRRFGRSEYAGGNAVERIYDVRAWGECAEVGYPTSVLVHIVAQDEEGQRKVANEFRYEYQARSFVEADRIERPELLPPMVVVDRMRKVAYELLEEGVRPRWLYDDETDTEILADEEQLRRATEAIPPHKGFVFRYLEPADPPR